MISQTEPTRRRTSPPRLRAAAGERARGLDWSLAIVIALTAVAFALRVRWLGDGLYRDEPVTLEEVQGRDLLGVLDVVATGVEYNPPLYFVAAWVSAKLGDATTFIRLPSLILSTATVPLVYLLGTITVGRRAALVGAGVMALSPFTIYYGAEARAYAMLMFFSALSALALLTALRTRGSLWWVLYGVSVAGMLYTHYTGVFVVAAQGAWTLWFHREHWRALTLAYVGAAIAYAPWLPHVKGDPTTLELWGSLVGWTGWQAFLQWTAGSPELPPSDLPGVVAFVMLACGLGVGLLGGAAGWARRRRAGAAAEGHPWRSPARLLVLLLALATPLALLLYKVVGHDIFVFARNLSASLPFAALALGWAVTPASRAVTVAAVGLVGVGIGIGTAKTLEDSSRRPNYPEVARLIDDRARPGDFVVHYGNGLEPYVLDKNMRIYYEREHAIRVGVADKQERPLAARTEGGRVFLVAERSTDLARPPAVRGLRRAERRVLPGFVPLTVVVYEERG